MAELKFTAASAKDTENLSEDKKNATSNGVTLDEKKGNVLVEAGSKLASGTTIDVSDSAFFKTVSVASGYEGEVGIEGNGTIANEFHAGNGGSTMYGGSGSFNDKAKFTTAADKLYGGEGADVFVYEPNAGKDTFYNYKSFSGDGESEDAEDGSNDVIVIKGLTETQSLSFVDKSGGITITISDSNSESEVAAGFKAGDTAKNSVLTVDGKSAKANGGFIISDGENQSVYGAMPSEVGYAKKNGKDDTTTLTIGGAAEGDVNVGWISSTVKNISGSTDTDTTANAVYITGNGNANSITIGSGGGTVDPGYGAKATADKIFGTSSAEVTYIFDAVNGGKDVIGDAKLTQYNYKTGDKIVLLNSPELDFGDPAVLGLKNGDVVLTVDKNNSLTLKNAVGKAVNIYAGEVDAETGEIEINDEALVDNWGDTLPSGFAYDTKLSKISADTVAIANLPKTGTTTEKIPLGTQTLPDGSTVNVYYDIEVPTYDTIVLGGEGNPAFVTTVKEIDMSASDAPVAIDVSESEYANVSVIKVGGADSTIIGNTPGAESAIVTQTFTAGNGADLFKINAAAKLSAVAPNAKGVKSYKADVINGIGAGDSISIDAAIANISFVEKGKDLNINLNDDGTEYTVVTVKNFNSDTALTLVGTDNKKIAPTPMPSGLTYATKSNKIDKTGLVASGALAANAIVAADYGDTTIKNIDATGVTSSNGSKLEIKGGSAANNIYAPTTKSITTTLDGGAGNDNLTGGGGKTTYVFTAQDNGKKDVITGFKSGDVIVVDQSALTAYEEATFGDSDITYDKDGKGTEAAGGFNDSKADVVITINGKNSITVKEGAGKPITLVNEDNTTIGTYGHVLPSGLAFDSKNTTVSLSGGKYNGTIDLSDTKTYYSTIKKVDLTGNSVAASIIGNSLANELIAGKKGGLLDGGSVDGILDAKEVQIKPVADKLTGGDGKDTYVYDVGYGKDSFLNFGEGDVVSLGAEIGVENLSITDKNNILTVAITGDVISSDSKALTSAANSTFTITKTSANVPVTFVGEGVGSYTYGALPTGVSYGDKNGKDDYTVLNISTDDSANVDVSAINSQPKTIDARTSSGAVVLVGNANADAIYAGSGGSTLFGGTAGTKAVKDQLYGGAGTDYFVFTSQAGEKGKETDIVSNYVAGDVIVLDRAPDLVKTDGKAITLTFNDEVTSGSKTSVVASTLVINGAATDSTMKKFNTIDASVEVSFAIGGIYDKDTDAFDLAEALKNTVSYKFNPNATAEVEQSNGSLKAVELKKGIPWEQLEEALGIGEEEEAQFAATDGWFNEVVSTDNASVSELDSILDAKGALNGDLAALDGDAFFTNTSFESRAAAITGARHQAKK